MTLYFSMKNKGFYDDVIHKTIPNDATEMSAEYHQTLLNAQSSGKVIAWDGDVPYAKDYNPITNEQLAKSARSKRDRLIAATDYLFRPDYPISDELLDKVKVYSQLLRDITEQAGFPTDIDWPKNPLED